MTPLLRSSLALCGCLLLFIKGAIANDVQNVTIEDTEGWPEGTYGIPMPKTGCPVSSAFKWETGSRTHQTEFGSHGSDNIHLAGIYSRKGDRITQSFCMKTYVGTDSPYYWEPGKYCIYKSGPCPNDFHRGWIYWDDAAPFFATDTAQTTKGKLPEGEYNRNTRIEFCCRRDGNPQKDIHLPNKSPFHLMKIDDVCQQIYSMESSEEWVYWLDETLMNLNAQGGVHPKVQRSKYPVKFTKLFYCYYTPKPEKDMLKTALQVVYIIAGIVGAILVVLVIICITQRLFSRKPKEYEDNSSNARMERQSTQFPNEPVVYYQANAPIAAANMTQPPMYKMPSKSGLPPEHMTDPLLMGSGGSSPRQVDSRTCMLGPDEDEMGMRPISQPPSYEEVMRQDSNMSHTDANQV